MGCPVTVNSDNRRVNTFFPCRRRASREKSPAKVHIIKNPKQLNHSDPCTTATILQCDGTSRPADIKPTPFPLLQCLNGPKNSDIPVWAHMNQSRRKSTRRGSSTITVERNDRRVSRLFLVFRSIIVIVGITRSVMILMANGNVNIA